MCEVFGSRRRATPTRIQINQMNWICVFCEPLDFKFWSAQFCFCLDRAQWVQITWSSGVNFASWLVSERRFAFSSQPIRVRCRPLSRWQTGGEWVTVDRLFRPGHISLLSWVFVAEGGSVCVIQHILTNCSCRDRTTLDQRFCCQTGSTQLLQSNYILSVAAFYFQAWMAAILIITITTSRVCLCLFAPAVTEFTAQIQSELLHNITRLH